MPARVASDARWSCLEEMPDHADAQPLHALAELGREIRHRPIDAGRVLGVGAGHALQQQRAIFRRPGHRAGVIEREGQRQNSRPTGQAISRLDSGNAAKSRRSADRSTGVGPGSAQDETRGDGRPGARGRSRREVVPVPGVARRRPRQVEGRPTEGKFMRRQLAQHDGTRVRPLLHRMRIARGHIVLQQLRMRRRADPGGIVDVLVRDRDAVELAAQRSRHLPRLRGFGIRQRAVFRHEEKRIQVRIEAADTVEMRLREFDR